MTVNKLYTSLPANHITAKQTNHVQQTRLYNIIDWQLLFTWLWRWLLHRWSKCQSPTTVLFRTTLTRTITLHEQFMYIDSKDELANITGIMKTLTSNVLRDYDWKKRKYAWIHSRTMTFHSTVATEFMTTLRTAGYILENRFRIRWLESSFPEVFNSEVSENLLLEIVLSVLS